LPQQHKPIGRFGVRGKNMPFAGFDSLLYPGDDTMQWIKSNTNFSYVGFYLAPAPSRPDSGWIAGTRAPVWMLGCRARAGFEGE
jgi:hypothetical protein